MKTFMLVFGLFASGVALAKVTILPEGTHVKGCTIVGYTPPHVVFGFSAKKMFERLDKLYIADAEAAGANVVLVTYHTLKKDGGDNLGRAPMLKCPEPLVFD